MADPTTPNKALFTPANGADVDTWDIPVNANWATLDEALGGRALINATGLSGVQALTADQYQPLKIQINGTPINDITYVVPALVGGIWIFSNNTSGGHVVGLASAGGGSIVTVPSAQHTIVTCDGGSIGMVPAVTTTGAAAGSNTQIQYNSSGSLGASAGLTFDGTTLGATGLNIAGNTTLGATSGSTLTLTGTAVAIPNDININAGQLFLDQSTGLVGVGITTGLTSKFTVGGSIRSTSGGYAFPDNTVQTTAATTTPATIAIPVGTVFPYAGATAPNANYLLCFGQAVSRTTYAALFAVIGVVFGSGDGTTTFNLPDLRGRLAAGADAMGGTPANRLGSGATGGITGAATVGAAGGEQSHQLTTAELAAHSHTGSFTTGSAGSGSGSGITVISTTANTGSAGSGQTHNNVQPTLVLNYIIKLTAA